MMPTLNIERCHAKYQMFSACQEPVKPPGPIADGFLIQKPLGDVNERRTKFAAIGLMLSEVSSMNYWTNFETSDDSNSMTLPMEAVNGAIIRISRKTWRKARFYICTACTACCMQEDMQVA